jgi:energy-converting hydrogenase Eha subunit B
VALVAALGCGVWAGRFVWRKTAVEAPGLLGAVVLGALITGGIGFCGGFFGPLIFRPDANQGPLLGILITGPLGFVLGGIGGGIYWGARGRHQ